MTPKKRENGKDRKKKKREKEEGKKGMRLREVMKMGAQKLE